MHSVCAPLLAAPGVEEREEAAARGICRLAEEELEVCPVAGTDACATANNTANNAKRMSPMAQMYHMGGS